MNSVYALDDCTVLNTFEFEIPEGFKETFDNKEKLTHENKERITEFIKRLYEKDTKHHDHRSASGMYARS